MKNQMRWQRPRAKQPKILFIDEGDGFIPYANSVHAVPDRSLHALRFKGYDTYQKLYGMGWELVDEEQ
jgi:hypothetical protein